MDPKSKKIPERLCVACRQMKPKNQLIRIVNGADGVTIDFSGKKNGRGVYLCKCRDCISKALRGKGFVKQNGFSLEQIADQLESLIEE